MRYRTVTQVVSGQEVLEGAGVRIRRTLGTPALDHFDPFLLLDEFKSDQGADYIAGFPDHPHRGFETVTYMLAGSMKHEDHKGNRGELGPGSVQWMTAGRGIVHSEMPMQRDGLMWGFQLWVNLPGKDKMTEPRYQDIPKEAIPELVLDGGTKLRIICGTIEGVEGPVRGIKTAPLYADVALPKDAECEIVIPSTHNAFCYVFDGEGTIGETLLAASQLGVLSPEKDGVRMVTTERPLRLLLLAAKPLGEPVERYGPFVMNTREEIHRAFEDYERGTFLG